MKPVPKASFYSLVRSDKLNELLKNKDTQNPTNIFENKYKNRARGIYNQITEIAQNKSISESSKVNKLNRLVDNFDSNFDKKNLILSQNKESKPIPPIVDIHANVKPSFKHKSKLLLQFLEKRGLKYDNTSLEIHEPSLSKEGPLKLNTILEYLTNKRTQTLDENGERGITNFVNHFKIPNNLIRNPKYQLKHVGKGFHTTKYKPKKKQKIRKEKRASRVHKKNKKDCKPKWINFK